jgi:HEAT repeat protein
MRVPLTLTEFFDAVARFVEGTSSAPWRSITQYLYAIDLERLDSAELDTQVPDQCWQMLCSPDFDSSILYFYNAAGRRNENDGLVRRLGRNARALFAAALAAAESNRVNVSGQAVVLKWAERAVLALDPGCTITTKSKPIEDPIDATGSLSTAFELFESKHSAVAAAHTWALHCLNPTIFDPCNSRNTWISWVSDSGSGSGTIEVIETTVRYRAIVEHPKSALLPAEKEWVDTVVSAWKLSGCAESGRTYLWNVSLPPPWIPLAHESAGAAFYVGFSCLRNGRPCDRSRAVLAALTTERGGELRPVRSIDDKIAALPKIVRAVAVAKEQVFSSSHADIQISKCTSTAAAVDFLSDLASKMRDFVLDNSTGVTTHPYIEPLLQVIPANGHSDARGEREGDNRKLGKTNLVTGRAFIRDLTNECSRRTIVVGDSGFGKTLLAKQVIKTVGEFWLDSLEDCESLSDQVCFPIFLEAGDIARAIDRREGAPHLVDEYLTREVLNEAAQARYPKHSEVMSFAIGKAWDDKGEIRLLLVVDNLDRLPPGLRDRVFMVLRQVALSPCNLLLTSRAYAFEPEDLPGFTIYGILELTPIRARRHAAALLVGEPQQAALVVHLLNSDQNVTLLARSPLLLTMICHASRRANGFQPTRTSLYRDYLLNQLAYTNDPVGAQSRFTLLQDVGNKWFTTAGPAGEVSGEQLASWLGSHNIQAYPINILPEDAHLYSTSALALKLLDNLVARGIFVPTRVDCSSYRANHPSIIEYLAAVKIAVQIDTDGHSLLGQLSSDAVELKWRDVIPFVAGTLKDPSKLLSQMLTLDDPFYLRLTVIANCLAEISPSTGLVSDAEQIARRLVDLLRSPSKGLRRSAVEALARMAIPWASVISPVLRTALDNVDLKAQASTVEAACAIGIREFADVAAQYALVDGAKHRDEVLRRLAMASPEVASATAINLLSDSNLDVRCAASETLVSVNGESYRNVIDQLKTGDGWSRRVASRSLSLSEDSNIVNEVTPLLHHDSAAVRASAVEIIAALKPSWTAQDWVQVAMADTSPDVRVQVTRAPAVGSDRLRFMLHDPNERVVLGAIDGLLSYGTAKASDFEWLLEHKMASVRMRAAEACCRCGMSDCLERLLTAVRDDKDAAFFALAALASLRESESVPILLEILPNVRSALQLRIVSALGHIGDKRSTQALVNLLRQPDIEIQSAAVLALGRIGDVTAFEPLGELVETENATVRRALVQAFGMLRNERAVNFLLHCLRIPDPYLIHGAISAIKSSVDFTGLIKAIADLGGVCTFALSCPTPWTVYDLFHAYAINSPTSSWIQETDEFTELLTVMHRGLTLSRS